MKILLLLFSFFNYASSIFNQNSPLLELFPNTYINYVDYKIQFQKNLISQSNNFTNIKIAYKNKIWHGLLINDYNYINTPFCSFKRGHYAITNLPITIQKINGFTNFFNYQEREVVFYTFSLISSTLVGISERKNPNELLFECSNSKQIQVSQKINCVDFSAKLFLVKYFGKENGIIDKIWILWDSGENFKKEKSKLEPFKIKNNKKNFECLN